MEILSDYRYNEVGKRGTGKEMCRMFLNVLGNDGD